MARRKPDTNPTPRPRAREVFLAVLSSTGNVTTAAREAGVHRATPYEWREVDKIFAAAWASAEETATDALEAEARRRAVEGWDEPVFQGGGQVGVIRKYSDRMLEILLKGHRHAFRENHRVEVSGPDGGAVQVESLVSLVKLAASSDKSNAPVDEQPK